FLLMGCISLGANVFWTIYIRNTHSDWIHYPLDLMFAVIAFAVYWFKGYFRATEQTRSLADQLQLANQRKDDFLVSTSHELRNPLNGVINLTQRVLEDQSHPVHPDHKERLQVQLNISKRMSLLLDDLLDVRRLKDNSIRLNIQEVRLPATLSGIVTLLQYTLPGKPVTIETNIDRSFPPVLADENRFVQIVYNLLHNAVKFTEKGTITLSAEHVDGVAYIHIKDTGIGMEKEMLDRIFLNYEQ